MTNTTELFQPNCTRDFIRARCGEGADAQAVWLRISYIAILFKQSCAIYAQTSDGNEAPAYTLAQYANEEDAENGLLDLISRGMTDDEHNDQIPISNVAQAKLHAEKAPEPSVSPVAVLVPVPEQLKRAEYVSERANASTLVPGQSNVSARGEHDIMNVPLFDKLALTRRAAQT